MKKAALVIALFAAIGFVTLVSADTASAFFFGGKGLFGGKASYGCATPAYYGCYYPTCGYACPPAGCKVWKKKKGKAAPAAATKAKPEKAKKK
ncbi:hypothetical protein [Desulfomonile tiedjei]|uniref:Uncharacterized protein n=1 Tax=Desulfomonile tiedjei (strain ATCC 49306 / DSM 6799 / DCB-1) TaxID=706587 RepID=I4C7B6_DESTA|nr:hypothetical protein [Desulfomonile tiedjei]AFM25457.1 hypothetical protein Desti_2786 [Desulfomonile tiedjei DSM 6799]